ncbi:MAG: helix-turn-helix domain-containing protein [Erythrobacter sp.]
MAAKVFQLRTAADRLQEEQAAQLRQMVLGFEGLPERAVNEIAAAIDRQTAGKKGWTFIMLSPDQNAAVVRWIMANSCQPMVAARLWAELFTAMRTDTGEIVMTRDELADLVKIRPGEVSRIMGELESCGAISRRRERVPGMRGPGTVSYFMNPRVATCLAGKARDEAQAKAPPLLVLMEGGRKA